MLETLTKRCAYRQMMETLTKGRAYRQMLEIFTKGRVYWQMLEGGKKNLLCFLKGLKKYIYCIYLQVTYKRN